MTNQTKGNTMKHTQGPWEFDKEIDIIFGDDTYICKLSDKNTKANAYLIAAAPELLEALDNLVLFGRLYSGDPSMQVALEAAEKVIAKAEGK